MGCCDTAHGGLALSNQLHAQIRTLVCATLTDRLLPLLAPERLDGPEALMELERSVVARTTELAGELIGAVLRARA